MPSERVFSTMVSGDFHRELFGTCGAPACFRHVPLSNTDPSNQAQGNKAHLARLILESADDFAVLTTDLDGCITSWSPGAERLLGWTEAEATGQDSCMIFTPEDQEAGTCERERQAAAEDGRAEDERYHVRQDGSRFWASGSLMRLEDDENQHIGFLKILRDRTEQHKVIEDRLTRESALEESQARLRLALDAANMAIWEMDLGTEKLTPSPSLAAFLGMKVEELADIELVRSRYHPDDRPRVRAEAQAALARGDRKFETEFRFLRSNNDVRWFLLRADVMPSSKGEPEHVLGALVDITALKAAEEALRASEGKFQAIANSIDQMIWATRPDGYHDYFNDRWYEYTGIPLGRTDGDGWSDLFHPDDVERTWKVWEHSLATGDPYHIEYRLRHRSGSYRWVIGRAQPVRDEYGRITRWYGTCTDVHDLKMAEEQLRDLNETLEQRVEQRTAELEQAQEALRQSQKLEAMGTLTGGVAHDFNNLLTPIIGGLDMLQRRGVGDERAQRQIAGALQSAERAKTLVQRLLAFARRQPLQPTAVEMEPLLEGMVELIASTSGPRIDVQLDVEPSLPPARADANQLEMALLNLAVNARDAMPEGGVLSISAALEEVGKGERSAVREGKYICLAVADTGQGMDSETLQRAVEPFFSTKGVGRGTGLGLSMVHGLALQLGGALEIQSRPSLGTKVSLLLPTADGRPAAAESGEAKPHLDASGLVLLVDDEELVRSSTSDMLAEMGYAVEEADSAEAALRRLKEGLRPDILVTDHLMPGMTGTDLVRTAWEMHPGLPALLISGYAEDQGVDPDIPRLTKPFRRSDLGSSLADLRKS